MKHTFKISHEANLRPMMANAYMMAKGVMTSGKLVRVTVAEETRTTAQNSLMWAMLNDVSRQVDWYGNKLTAEEWKDVLTAALKRQKVVPGIDGGFVSIGARTSQMTISEMTDLIALMEAFGAERGVKFSAPDYE